MPAQAQSTPPQDRAKKGPGRTELHPKSLDSKGGPSIGGAALSEHFQDIEPIQLFYHRWKELLIEATVLVHEGTSPDNAAAQDMAGR